MISPVLDLLIPPLSVSRHLTPNPHFLPPVHRNMPKDQALDFVEAEYRHRPVKDGAQRDPADVAAQASQLLGDFLDREKIERHSVPSETRQLLMLFAEGVHLYPDELETISEYVRSRQEHQQGGTLIILSYPRALKLTLELFIPFVSFLEVMPYLFTFSLSLSLSSVQH